MLLDHQLCLENDFGPAVGKNGRGTVGLGSGVVDVVGGVGSPEEGFAKKLWSAWLQHGFL